MHLTDGYIAKAVVVLSDLDRRGFPSPIQNSYRMDFFRPVVNVDGYYTSIKITSDVSTELLLEKEIEVLAYFMPGPFELVTGKTYYLMMSSRRIGTILIQQFIQ